MVRYCLRNQRDVSFIDLQLRTTLFIYVVVVGLHKEK